MFSAAFVAMGRIVAPGAVQVRKFTDRKTAVRRIWKAARPPAGNRALEHPLAEAPLTSAAALGELRQLLDSLHSNSQRGNASLNEMRREDKNEAKENTGDGTDE